jgi:hypothetical protein
MEAARSDEIAIPIGSDGKAAAEHIHRALKDRAGRGGMTARLDGRVEYPKVTVWRSRGRFPFTPFTRFEGSVEDVGGQSAIVGRVTTPAVRSLSATLTAFTAFAGALIAAALGVASATPGGVAAGLVIAAALLGWLYVMRRLVTANARAETEMLLRELRELVQQHAETDS